MDKEPDEEKKNQEPKNQEPKNKDKVPIPAGAKKEYKK